MSEAAVETSTTPVVFGIGDRVRIADRANDGTGYGVPSDIQGQVGVLQSLDSYYGWAVKMDSTGRTYYVGPQYLTKVSDAEVKLLDQIARLTGEVETLTAARDTQAKALDTFKLTVRNTLVRKAENTYNGDEETYDDLLSDFGLEGRERDFEISVEFRGSYTTTITATSLNDAYDIAGSKDAVVEYLADSESARYALDDIETEESE